MKLLDYIKVNKVSERITGDPLKIRATSKPYKEHLRIMNQIIEDYIKNIMLR